MITRHGRAVVALVRADRLQQLERLGSAGLAGLARGWRGSEELESAGRPLADADLQIAATALVHDLELVTGNVTHFERVPGLRVSHVPAEARTRS